MRGETPSQRASAGSPKPNAQSPREWPCPSGLWALGLGLVTACAIGPAHHVPEVVPETSRIGSSAVARSFALRFALPCRAAAAAGARCGVRVAGSRCGGLARCASRHGARVAGAIGTARQSGHSCGTRPGGRIPRPGRYRAEPPLSGTRRQRIGEHQPDRHRSLAADSPTRRFAPRPTSSGKSTSGAASARAWPRRKPTGTRAPTTSGRSC